MHTHAATDIVNGTIDNARTSGTASATASTLVLRDGSGGASFGYVAANNQWAYLDSHFQSFGCGRVPNGGRSFREHGKVRRGLHRRDLGQKRRVMFGHRGHHNRAGWQYDRGHHHGGDRDADHPAAGGGPRVQRPEHALRLCQGRIGHQTGVHRHRGQRLCRRSRGPDEHHAHDRLAAVQDHRHAGRRADRALDRCVAVRRQRRQLDRRCHLPLGRVPAAGLRSKERIRPHVGVANHRRSGRNGVARS